MSRANIPQVDWMINLKDLKNDLLYSAGWITCYCWIIYYGSCLRQGWTGHTELFVF